MNRFSGSKGYCRTDAGINIFSICIHKGEEPAISGPSGICNIFFSGCNLRCVYCQNYQISRSGSRFDSHYAGFDEVLNRIEDILSNGIRNVGFVSPSHVVPQVKAIIRGLKARNLNPVTVYNTNSYDKSETIDSLSGMIGVWLPDLKYVSASRAQELSDAPDYPEIALSAIKRMYYQKGSTLHLDDEGRAESGMLLRHLVLPGLTDESVNVLQTLADEISPGIYISLMSQYHPNSCVAGHKNLRRTISRSEYETVVRRMEELGFRNGWIQEMGSSQNYLPDFLRDHPFE